MSSKLFRFELHSCSLDEVNEANKREGRTGAAAFEPFEEVQEQISKAKRPHSKRLDSWINHPDERVLKFLADKDAEGSVIPWREQFKYLFVTRALRTAKAEGVMWTPVLDSMVPGGWSAGLGEAWLNTSYINAPKVKDVLEPFVSWIEKQKDFSGVRPVFENYSATPIRSRIAEFYPHELPEDVFDDFLKDEAIRAKLAKRQILSEVQLRKILDESVDIIKRACKPRGLHSRNVPRNRMSEKELEKVDTRTADTDAGAIFESLAKTNHSITEDFKEKISAIISEPQTHKRSWATTVEVQKAALWATAHLGEQFSVESMVKALLNRNPKLKLHHGANKLEEAVVSHEDLDLDNARRIMPVLGRWQSRAALVEKFGEDKKLWNLAYNNESTPAGVAAMLQNSTPEQEEKVYRRLFKALRANFEATEEEPEFARWGIHPLLMERERALSYPLWARIEFYEALSSDSEEVCKLIHLYSHDMDFLKHVAENTSYPTARRALAKNPEARAHNEIREILRNSSFGPVLMEFAKEALEKRDFDDFQELIAVVGAKVPKETMALLREADSEVIDNLSGKALQGIFAGGDREIKLEAMDLLGKMRGKKQGRSR